MKLYYGPAKSTSQEILLILCYVHFVLQSKKMSRYPNDCKVYVGELGNSARKNDLEDSFSYYGPLRNVCIATNPPR